jgi:hypothetical protein
MKAASDVQIFLNYASEDERHVKTLYQKLHKKGFKPWMDKLNILPGEDWELSIDKAIQYSDFFLACVSKTSIQKRGYVQLELKQALKSWQKKFADDIYLIPVRLDDCELPEILRKFQWVDFFDKRRWWTNLLRSLEEGMKRLP